MFRNLKIAKKLILLLLVISVVPVLAISVASYSYTKATLEQKTIDSLRAVNDSRAAHINHAIQLRQEQAKEFAGAYLPRQLRESGLNSPAVIQGIQEDIDSTFNDLKLPPTSPYRDIDKKTDIEIIGVWDVHGTIIANTKRNLIGMQMPLEYLQNVYNQGTYFRGFEKDPLTGKNYLINLEEIRNWKSGMIVGAVSLKINARILNEITTARQGLGQSGETYLVDSKYLMITPSRFIDGVILNARVITDGTQACFSKEEAPPIYRNYRDVTVLGVQQHLPDQNWCLVTEVDAKEAFAPITALRNRTIVIGGSVILALLLIAYLASSSFTRPIVRLHDASQEIKQGNYAVEVPVDSKDEVGELSRAFNEMARSLASTTRALEEKSAELFGSLALSTRQKQELTRVNRELDSFVYTASHDLRAPLRGIASFAAFLEEDYKNKLDAQGKDYLDEIKNGATKMNALIDDLLLLSRISRIQNPYEYVNINELIQSVVERITFDLKEHKVALKVQEHMPTVRCDRIKMSEVFLNLINNAVKFSSKNKKTNPAIEVGYIPGEAVHTFFVKDNGIGIDPQFHQQIFGIFKRLHTDKEYEGTGAGLSIIKRVIDDHQGKIWIESTLGHGATFYFTIPKGLDVPAGGDTAKSA